MRSSLSMEYTIESTSTLLAISCPMMTCGRFCQSDPLRRSRLHTKSQMAHTISLQHSSEMHQECISQVVVVVLSIHRVSCLSHLHHTHSIPQSEQISQLQYQLPNQRSGSHHQRQPKIQRSSHQQHLHRGRFLSAVHHITRGHIDLLLVHGTPSLVDQ